MVAGAELRLDLLTSSAVSRLSDAGHPSGGQRISLRIRHHDCGLACAPRLRNVAMTSPAQQSACVMVPVFPGCHDDWFADREFLAEGIYPRAADNHWMNHHISGPGLIPAAGWH